MPIGSTADDTHIPIFPISTQSPTCLFSCQLKERLILKAGCELGRLLVMDGVAGWPARSVSAGLAGDAKISQSEPALCCFSLQPGRGRGTPPWSCHDDVCGWCCIITEYY